MSVTATKFITAATAAALNTAIAAEIAASRYPVGRPIITRVKQYPAKLSFSQRIDTGATAVAEFRLIEADSLDALTTSLTTEIAAGRLPSGDPIQVNVGNQEYGPWKFYQATAKAGA